MILNRNICLFTNNVNYANNNTRAKNIKMPSIIGMGQYRNINTVYRIRSLVVYVWTPENKVFVINKL